MNSMARTSGGRGSGGQSAIGASPQRAVRAALTFSPSASSERMPSSAMVHSRGTRKLVVEDFSETGPAIFSRAKNRVDIVYDGKVALTGVTTEMAAQRQGDPSPAVLARRRPAQAR